MKEVLIKLQIQTLQFILCGAYFNFTCPTLPSCRYSVEIVVQSITKARPCIIQRFFKL